MSNELLSSLNKSVIPIEMTPPIRRITDNASSSSFSFQNSFHLIKNSIKSNTSEPLTTNLRERSISSNSTTSSLSKLSNNDSLESFSPDPSANQDNDDDDDDDDDDDRSSNEEDTNHRWNLNQLASDLSLRQLMVRHSVSIINDNPIAAIPMCECRICLEELSIVPLSCCSSSICSKCLYYHLSLNISEGHIRIICPSCSHIFTREEILSLLSQNDHNGNIAERYKRFYANINGETHIKTCPKCCSIKEIDRNLCEGIRWKRNIPRKVLCNDCQFEWCFYCHSPWHEKMTCKEYQQGEKMLRLWAEQIDENQHNAQKCPRCKVYISRNGGCPHMICSKCQCDFCYNCGKRRLGLKFLGSHESRYSPLGCKYNLYPDKPILRHTVRGLIASAATLALPVAAVGAIALLAVGTTIGAPTYGTYRLVKHIRSKRHQSRRRYQMENLSRQWTTDDSLATYVNDIEEHNIENNDFEKAIQASLITYQDESSRREQRQVTPYPIRRLIHNHIDDDDDDSLDE